MPLAYPPYSSRPAAQSASATIPPPVSSIRPGTGSTVGMNDLPTTTAAAGDPNKYLQEAREIEITFGDRQEGYDADLVNLPERNTAARAARPSIEPPPNSAGPLLAATLPYPSRTLNGTGNGNDDRDKGGAGSDDPQRLPSTRRADRLGVRHYSSSAARPDHSRSKSERNTGPHGGRRRESGRKHQQQRRKKLAWWERPRFLVIALVLIVAIGLGVGLGVGLSQANKNKRNDNNDGGNNSNGGINPPSRSGEAGGVPVSVSANDVVPMALPTTAETLRPAIAAQTMAPAAAPPHLGVVSLAELRRMTRKR